MGRFNNMPLEVLADVTLEVKDRKVVVKGTKGELVFNLHASINIDREGDVLRINKNKDYSGSAESFIGMTYRILGNLMTGVKDGYSKILDVEGVGYRWKVNGKVLNLQLGYSHDINYDIPEGITIVAEGSSLTISGISKEVVGGVAAKIKAFRPVEPYKGKGIRYRGQYVVRKAGKSGA